MTLEALSRTLDGTGLDVIKLKTNRVLVFRDATPLIDKWKVCWNERLDKPWYFEREFATAAEAARWYTKLTPRKLEQEIKEANGL